MIAPWNWIGRVALLIKANILWTLGALLLVQCMSSSHDLRKYLSEAAEEDMKVILQDIPPGAKSAVLTKPYYIIDEFEEFKGDTALVYQARAQVVFFYLDASVGLCQIRKYRFKRRAHSWERYQVDLKHTPQRFIDGPTLGEGPVPSN